jgi:predicted RNA binding protein YcfA (HicA-like mRNA interferase family)
LKQWSGREFARLLERRGWQLLRVNGSHHIFGRVGSIVRLSVPIHGNRPLKTGLLLHLAKLAGIPEEEMRK